MVKKILRLLGAQKFGNFNDFLHEARSMCIRRLGFKAGSILHAGAAGEWYFEWFCGNYKFTAASHTGVDLNPRPPGLPGGIAWHSQDASDLSAFPPGSYDMVFAGQFIEHLDAGQQARFLAGACRALKKGGALVIDSPNFAVSNLFAWKQPEHILELTCGQAEALLEAAGFRVASKTGLLPKRLFPAASCAGRAALSIDMNNAKRDIRAALSRDPEDCFIWWFVCEKTGEADEGLLGRLCQEFSAQNKSAERKAVYSQTGGLAEMGGKAYVKAPASAGAGFVLYGPYEPYGPGSYTAQFEIHAGAMQGGGGPAAFIDAAAGSGATVLARAELTAGDLSRRARFRLDFALDAADILQTRAYTYGKADLAVCADVAVTRVDGAQQIARHKRKYGVAEGPADLPKPLCSSVARRIELDAYENWARAMGFHADNKTVYHRKVWEWVYIAQALSERGMLRPGARGLGFAVGREPLPALFAKHGVKVTATDLDEGSAAEWADGGQHADGLPALEHPHICDSGTLRENVAFETLDMNDIPAGIGGYDFCWSSCAFEHLGGEEKGRAFILNTLKLLKPGGVSVHTTEYNISSDESADLGKSVVYGRRFFDALRGEVSGAGHYFAPLDYRLGSTPEDDYVFEPGGQPRHFKLMLGGHVSTSIGVIIQTR